MKTEQKTELNLTDDLVNNLQTTWKRSKFDLCDLEGKLRSSILLSALHIALSNICVKFY